jgi:hypothetical protein
VADKGMTAGTTSNRKTVYILLVMLLVVLFAPAFLYLWTGSNPHDPWRIGSLTWLFGYTGFWDFGFSFVPEFSPFALHYYGLRYLILFMVYRFYTGQSGLRLTLGVTLLGELQFALMANMSPIMMILTDFILMISTYHGALYLPIPFPFLAILVLSRLISPPEPEKMWIEEEESENWWETTNV